MKKVIIYGFGLTLLDQVIKIFISAKMQLNQTIEIIKGFLHITYVTNTGASFSILEGNTYIIALISIIALVYIYKYLLKGKELNKFEIISYSLLIGGIFGNLIDRVIRMYVIDYIDIYIFGYNFPVFNLADICIVSSVILFLFGGKYANNK